MERLGGEIIKNATEMDATIQLLRARVDGLVVEAADAQATIAALEQRVKELKQWVQDQSTANLETMRHMDEMQSRAMDAESQLTQRTAELEAAKRERDEWIVKWDEHDHYPKGYVTAQIQLRERVQAELERVRGERCA